MMNKKGLEDSFFTWVIGFSFIVFFMLIYLLGVFALYGKSGLFGFIDSEAVMVEEGSKDLILNKEILNILNKKIEVEDKKIINMIKESLDGFFEVKNDKEESFVEVFGIEGIGDSRILNRVWVNEFDEKDIEELGKLEIDYQNSVFLKEIKKELDKRCSKYRLKLPLGFITEQSDRVMMTYRYENDLISENEVDLGWTPTIIHKNNYRGENFEIKFRMLKKCAGGFENELE